MNPNSKMKELRRNLKTKNQEIKHLRNLLRNEKEQHSQDLKALRLTDQVTFKEYHKLVSDLQKTIIDKDKIVRKLTKKKSFKFKLK